jgi:hypothetical protein
LGFAMSMYAPTISTGAFASLQVSRSSAKAS